MKIPTIRTLMTAFPYTIDLHATVIAARKMMREHDIRHLPVTENKKLVAVLSEHDIDLALSLGKHVVEKEHLTVCAVCTKDPYMVPMTERLDRALLTMAELHVSSAVVMKGDKLAGIFTTSDVCRCMGELLMKEKGEVCSDIDPECA